MASDSVLRFLRIGGHSLLASCALLVLLVAKMSYGAPQEPAAVAVVTDQTSVTLSDKFFTQSPIGLKANGDVFFGTSSSEMFYWNSTTGTRTRLLQVNDPIPGFPGSVAVSVASPFRLNSAGHAALLNTWAAPGVRNPNGIFVYDGSTYSKVVLNGEAVPGLPGSVFSTVKDLRVNASDQVAFVATYEPVGEYMLGVFLGSPSGPPSKIATTADLRSLVGGVDNIYLIGVDNSGNVAFLCENFGNPFGYSVVIGSPSGTLHAIKTMDGAPGTSGVFALQGTMSYYAFNSAGDLAFYSDVWNDPTVYQGIWVRSASGTIQKLVVNGDASGTSLGGTYNFFTFRGLNDGGQVLYTAGVTAGTSNNGLFLKSLAGGTDVLCYRDQVIAGGPQAVDNAPIAQFNSSGKAVVVANLKNPAGRALLLCSGSADPQVIVLEGSETPAGGTYAQIGTVRINASDQVVFRSDILPLNANGLFFWASGSPIQAIVTTADTVASGANTALFASGVVASDDEMVFWPYKAEGKDTIFTKSLRPGPETIRRVIGDGDAAPSGGMLAYINNPAINDKEELVVFASVIGGTPYPADALWLSKPGAALQKLVMTNDAAPGSGGGQFSGFPSQPRVNNNSEVAFYANLKNASNNSFSGVFLISASGTIYSIARVGDASPAGGAFVSFSTTIYLSDTGQVAFRATSQSGGNTPQIDGLFVGSATAAPVKLMAVGDSWGAGTFSWLGSAFKMNKAGQVVFHADLSFNDGGIFVASSGTSPVAIALADNNTPIPGAFLSFTFPDAYLDINSSGQVAFWAVYFTNAGYGIGYFVGSATTPPTARVSMGQALPGGGTCPLLLPVTGGLALADSGELAMYIPNVSGAADLPRYVIAGSDGTLRAFAAVGDAAGDTGSVFGRLTTVTANSAGTFFIGATLVGGPAKQGVFRSATASRTVGDMNGDGKSDVLWRHATLGEVWLWPMDGAARTSETYVRTVADTNWEIRGVADQDGDGYADILWRNKTTGAIYAWRMQGSTRLAETYVATVDLAYDVVGTGDFNGDRKSDILWRNLTNGEVWIWLMDGATPLSRVYVGTVDPAYVIEGVGDLDGDSKADIVWHHATLGEVWVWLMNGTTRLSSTWVATVPDVGYQIAGVADFTGDGRADILWHHATAGEVWLWPMAGTARVSETYVATVPDTNYRIVDTGDYNGDGKADILWHHTTLGEVWAWLMDGATRLSETWVGTVPDVGYRIINVR
jgi:hypothetical protein